MLYRGLGEPSAVVDARGYIVLSNFRYARRLLPGAEAFSLCGDPAFMAPECVRGSGHGHAADWWSLGVLVYSFVTGASPWHLGLGQEQNEVVTYQRITSHVRGALKLRGPRSAVAHATDLINALLEPEPDERLGARAGGLAELQAHPFFDGVDWAALAAGTAPSPLAALASHQLNELLPDGGDGQPNPELGIETEPCPAELLSADGEAERFDGLS